MADLNTLIPEQFVAWCMAKLEERGFDMQKDPIPPVQVSEDGEGVNFSDGAVKELKKVAAFKRWFQPREAAWKAHRDHESARDRAVVTFNVAIDITSGVTPENREAQILANIQALGIDTEQYPVVFNPAGPHGHDRRYPIHVDADGSWRVEASAVEELTKTPSPFTDYWDRKREEIWEKMGVRQAAKAKEQDYELEAQLRKWERNKSPNADDPNRPKDLLQFPVDWTAPEFKAIGLRTADQLVKWLEQKLAEAGIQCQPWSVECYIDGSVHVDADTLHTLHEIPEYDAYKRRTLEEFKQEKLRTSLEGLTHFDVALPELKARIGDMVAAIAHNPDLAGDADLDALITTLYEAQQALVEGVQQLTHVQMPEEATEPPAPTLSTDPSETYATVNAEVNINDCLDGIWAALEKEVARAFQGDAWQQDHALLDVCRAAYQELQDTNWAIHLRVRAIHLNQQQVEP